MLIEPIFHLTSTFYTLSLFMYLSFLIHSIHLFIIYEIYYNILYFLFQEHIMFNTTNYLNKITDIHVIFEKALLDNLRSASLG